tara:strand:- start:11231 stop:12796 length:1566 start_codon:yes stop_codon:yes gene_type:complete
MVYPTFNIKSIQKRCESDLEHFYDIYNIDPEHQDYKDLKTFSIYDKTPSQLDIMKTSIKSKLAKILEISGKKNIKSFDYAHDVIHLDEVKQKKLWIVRTYIFYELLTFVTLSLSDEQLYNQIYTDRSEDKFPFRLDIPNELDNFKMGIFGSITPTSDIDIGFQYSGNTLKIPGLAYMVSRFENSFLIFTEINSLSFDIETYADMMTIPNTKPDKDQFPDYFYLDTSKFTKEHFQKVLVCAGTSILRNAVLAEMEIKGKQLTDAEINNVLNKFNMDDIMKINKVFDNFYVDIKDDFSQDWLEKAKKLVFDYMGSDYNQGRYKYYNLVNIAEESKFKGTKDIDNITVDQICEIMVNIGFSLTYRMESYNCAPTVIHVVRILQAAKEKAEKYKTLTPKTYCIGKVQYLDPYCSLGKYGYALSCLEQLGYIYRFYETYCVEQKPTYNKAKCAKKMNKYMGRYENGFFYFVQYYTGKISRGGKLFRIYKKQNKKITRRKKGSQSKRNAIKKYKRKTVTRKSKKLRK